MTCALTVRTCFMPSSIARPTAGWRRLALAKDELQELALAAPGA